MFFPIHTDRRLQTIPVINFLLIAANVLIYLLGSRHAQQAYMLQSAAPQLVQFITYQFLHLNFSHLLGNMVFLYVLGNSVEDRLGHVGYLAFYLAGGVLAGAGHAFMQPSPVLGASGAVCAVTGLYLVLFPLSRITIAFLFLFDRVELSSAVLIAMQVGFEWFMRALGESNVASLAHLSGYLFGFFIGFFLLILRILPGDRTDLWGIICHRIRRVRGTSEPLLPISIFADENEPEREKKYLASIAPQAPQETAPLSPQQQRIMELRHRIQTALETNRLEDAWFEYQQLLALDKQQVMGSKGQLDIANHLMTRGLAGDAALAYQGFLRVYDKDPQKPTVQVMLALVTLRYIGDTKKAVELLHAAIPHLIDADQIAMAKQLLDEANTQK